MSPTTAEVTTAELTPGVRIPLVGLGTWPLTGEDAAAAVHQAISNGYRHIDTAENYGNEAAVGRASAAAASTAATCSSPASSTPSGTAAPECATPSARQ